MLDFELRKTAFPFRNLLANGSIIFFNDGNVPLRKATAVRLKVE
jgi:hypothetical protein